MGRLEKEKTHPTTLQDLQYKIKEIKSQIKILQEENYQINSKLLKLRLDNSCKIEEQSEPSKANENKEEETIFLN